jgi:integrase
MAKGIYERKGKNGDITYYIRYQVDGLDIRERVGRKSRGCTKEIIKEALRARQGEVIQGKFNLNRVRKAIPFSQLAKRFHEYAKVNWRAYEENKNFITYAEREFGELPLSELTSSRIEQWKSKLRQNHKPGTVNVYLATLKNILFRAVEWGLLKSNPASSVKAIKLGDQRARYLTLEELKRLLEACGESSCFGLISFWL